AGNDNVQIVGSGSSFSVLGLHATVSATGSEAANDQLVVKGLGGNDTLNAATLAANVVNNLTLDGGTGNDVLLGSHGVDFLFGGDGNDFIDGNQGDDRALMGAGNDVFQWDPGDGSDIVEGGDGRDTMLFNGANIDEKIDISANGERVRFVRDIGNITMDLNDVERIDFNARGGVDQITINDLSGTDVTDINLDLAGVPGSGVGDGAADTVIVNGTNANDNIVVAGSAGNVNVTGLKAAVHITASEGANDHLTINALGG